MSSGTRSAASSSARIAPAAIMSVAATIASGGSSGAGRRAAPPERFSTALDSAARIASSTRQGAAQSSALTLPGRGPDGAWRSPGCRSILGAGISRPRPGRSLALAWMPLNPRREHFRARPRWRRAPTGRQSSARRERLRGAARMAPGTSSNACLRFGANTFGAPFLPPRRPLASSDRRWSCGAGGDSADYADPESDVRPEAAGGSLR